MNYLSVHKTFECAQREMDCLSFFIFCFAGVHLIAPPPKLQSDRPKLLEGQEVEKEGILMS